MPDAEVFDVSKAADPKFVAPDLTAAVEGWRSWRVSAELPRFGVAPKMYSVTHGNYYWTPRRAAEAECSRCEAKEVIDDKTGLLVMKGTGIPGEQCSCGFYSAKSLEHLLCEMSYHRYDLESGTFCAVGQVACWGKVIEGSQGWRSQFAYPVKLFVPFEVPKAVALALRKEYGVPVSLKNVLKPQKGR